MTIGVAKDKQGPLWPLGNIAVATPGTPVSIMSLVDSTNANAPNTPSSTPGNEYTERCYAIIFQPAKAGGGGNGLANNAGNVYIIKKSTASPGTQNRADQGAILFALSQQGFAANMLPQPFVLTAAALNLDVLSPYEYFIDADNAADGCQVTLVIQ